MAWSEAKWITDEIQTKYNSINDRFVKVPQEVSCFQIVQIENNYFLRVETPENTKRIDVLFDNQKFTAENRGSFFLVAIPTNAFHENLNLSFHTYSNENSDVFMPMNYVVDFSNIKKYTVDFTGLDSNIENDRIIGVLRDGNSLYKEIRADDKHVTIFVTGRQPKLKFISYLSNVPNQTFQLSSNQVSINLTPYDCSVSFTSQDEIAEVIINRLDNDEIYQYKAPCKSIYQFKIENIKVNSTLDLSIRFAVGKTVQFTHTFKKYGECWSSNVKAYKIYGIRRLIESKALNWERTDDNKDNLNFDKLYPWNKIRVINDYTYIPVFYYKREVQNGFDYIKICEAPIAGFVKHPASGYGVGQGYYEVIKEKDIDFNAFKGSLPNGLTAQVFFGVMLLSVIEKGYYIRLSGNGHYRKFEFKLYTVLCGYNSPHSVYDTNNVELEFYENDKKVILRLGINDDNKSICIPELPWLIGIYDWTSIGDGQYPFLIYGMEHYGITEQNSVELREIYKGDIRKQKYLGDNL